MKNQNDNLNNFIDNLLVDYYTIYPETPQIDFEIVFTDNLCQKHIELREDLKDELLKEGLEKENDSNGRTVFPKCINDKISILINVQRVIEYTNDNSYTWIGTIAHEFTHAIDFNMMAKKERLNTYDPLMRREGYHMFQLWSEYHARRLGYNFLRYELGIDSGTYTDEERIDNILNREIPVHMDRFYNEDHSDNDGNRQLYLTMQIAGRFSVWCDIFPEIFTDDFLKNTFASCPWLYNILVFLRKHESLDCIYDYFDEMRLILKGNWECL